MMSCSESSSKRCLHLAVYIVLAINNPAVLVVFKTQGYFTIKYGQLFFSPSFHLLNHSVMRLPYLVVFTVQGAGNCFVRVFSTGRVLKCGVLSKRTHAF